MDIYIMLHDWYDDDLEAFQQTTYGAFSTIEKAKEVANDILVNHFKVEPKWEDGKKDTIYSDINEDNDSYICIMKVKMDEIVESFKYMLKKEE